MNRRTSNLTLHVGLLAIGVVASLSGNWHTENAAIVVMPSYTSDQQIAKVAARYMDEIVSSQSELIDDASIDNTGADRT